MAFSRLKGWTALNGSATSFSVTVSRSASGKNMFLFLAPNGTASGTATLNGVSGTPILVSASDTSPAIIGTNALVGFYWLDANLPAAGTRTLALQYANELGVYTCLDDVDQTTPIDYSKRNNYFNSGTNVVDTVTRTNQALRLTVAATQVNNGQSTSMSGTSSMTKHIDVALTGNANRILRLFDEFSSNADGTTFSTLSTSYSASANIGDTTSQSVRSHWVVINGSTASPETIAVDTASIAVTTQAADVVTPTTVPADTQSFAVTTNDANINEVTNVQVDVASYAITTFDAETNAREQIATDLAVIAVDTQVTEINARELLTIDTAAIAVSTFDANVSADETIAVDTQSIAVTTHDPSLVADGVEAIDTLAISVTTEAATILAAETILVDPSTITIATQDAQLNEGNTILIDTADFVANTYPANINEVYRVVTDVAEISVTTYPMFIEADEFIAINTAAIDVVMHNAWLPVYWKNVITEATTFTWVANENGAAVKTAVTVTGTQSYRKYGVWIKPTVSGEWIKN